MIARFLFHVGRIRLYPAVSYALVDVPVFEPYFRTYPALMVYWSDCLSYIPTTTASVGLMFAKHSLNACSTYSSRSHKRPEARILYTKHGFLVCLTTLYMAGGSPRTKRFPSP